MLRRSVPWRTCGDLRGPRSGFRPCECREPGHLCYLQILVDETAEPVSSVRAVGAEVLEVRTQNDVEVAWSSDQDVIEAFAAQGADEAFGDRVRPGARTGCG